MHIAVLMLGLFIVGCGKQAAKPKVDPVIQAMQQAVAGSPAQVEVVGRTDWEVNPDQNQYWANVTLRNIGGDGQVAMRVAIQTMAPYVGLGENPTQPEYFQMRAGEMTSHRVTGTVSAKRADKAIGVAVEVYPKAPGQTQNTSPLTGVPGLGGSMPGGTHQMPDIGEGQGQ